MNLYDMCLTGKYNTDKYYGKYRYHSYVENIYNELFEPIRYSVNNIFEIGIQGGGSLDLWKDYFLNAAVFGVDINGPARPTNDYVQIMADAYSTSFIDFLPNNYFDIVIDDGPHSTESQITFVKNYASKVKSGGLLICEDIGSDIALHQIQKSLPITIKNYKVHDLRAQDKDKFSLVLVAVC